MVSDSMPLGVGESDRDGQRSLAAQRNAGLSRRGGLSWHVDPS